MFTAILMVTLGVIFFFWDLQRGELIELIFDLLFVLVNLVVVLFLAQRRRRIDRSLIEVDRVDETIIFTWQINSSIDKPKTIGNPECKYNARSPYLRCAINPDGDCQNCLHYLK